MAEYSRIARGSFTTASSVVPQTVTLPFMPTRVELLNYTTYSSPAQYAITKAWWDTAMGQNNTAFEYLESASAAWIPAVDYTTNGISTLGLLGSTNAGLMLQYGAQVQIASITKASPTVVTTASAHGYNVGDVVILEGLYQTSTTGMPQMCGIPFQITAVGSTTTFTVVWNSNQSNYTDLSGSPTGAYARKVLYPWNYMPNVCVISSITTGSTTTIVTTKDHNFVTGQEVAFRIPSAWGTTQLNSLPNAQIPGSPVYGIVQSVTNNTTFVVNINSSAYTAFTTNLTVAQAIGLTPPQVAAIGDINSGGVNFSGGALYPSQSFNTYNNASNASINGPMIQGAFANNTFQGFTVQNGAGAVQSSATLLTASSTYIWTAYIYDIG